MLMAAEFFQMIGTAPKAFDHMESRNAPRRSFAHTFAKANHHRRPVKLLDDPRCNDAEDARMPSFSSENERVAIAAVHGALSLCRRVLQHFGLYGAALAVMLIQLLRDPQRCFRRIRR